MQDPILSDYASALRRWSRTDPKLHALAKRHRPEARTLVKRAPFASLVESITHQQVSLAAGRTIYARVIKACGGRVTPAHVLEAGEPGLRACGLSRQKCAYVIDLAHRTAGGEVDFRRLRRASDEEVAAALTAVKGIGVWTAKMFLLFHMDRKDVFAPEDLGLRIAVQNLYGVPPKQAAKVMARQQAAWSPYNSLAALVLWNSRRVPDAPEARARARPRKTAAKGDHGARATSAARASKAAAVVSGNGRAT